MGSEGIVGIAKREEEGMIYPPHTGFGIGTNSKEFYIDRNVEKNMASQSPQSTTQSGGKMTTSEGLIPTTCRRSEALLPPSILNLQTCI